jgi:tetratricopeptide (TPR) repeat protein
MGKTALSVHVAHGLRDAFPDGQLYINLRGAEDGSDPTGPFEALGRFLRAVGVEGTGMPDTLEERLDLYRTLVSDLRILIVLDNAANDDQIRPLIPGGSSCAVITNSRARIGTTIGAHLLRLTVLEPAAAIGLLSGIAGPERVWAEPDAAADLCRQCGHLPLAIRVAAAKLTAKPHWSIRKLASLFADERHRLDHLMHGELDVRASITLSYAGLDPPVQQLLCRLGDMDLPEISVWLSAALMDSSLETAEELLESLFDAQLLDVIGQDITGRPRYQMHDLVRLFANERAQTDQPPTELQAARTRAFDATLSLADAATNRVYGPTYAVDSEANRWTLPAEAITDLVAEPMRWFESERHGLTATIRRAARPGCGTAYWEIVNATSTLFETLRLFDEWQDLLQAALQCARGRGDQRGQAVMLFWMSQVLANRMEYEQAKDHLRDAIELFKMDNDRRGYAIAAAIMGHLDRLVGNDDTAMRSYERALPMLRDVGDSFGEALVLRRIGGIYLARREPKLACSYFQRAFDTYRILDSPQGLAQTLYWMGLLSVQEERYADAERKFNQAREISRAICDIVGELFCLDGLALSAEHQGDKNRALSILSAALQDARQPKATLMETRIRERLAELSAADVPESVTNATHATL